MNLNHLDKKSLIKSLVSLIVVSDQLTRYERDELIILIYEILDDI